MVLPSAATTEADPSQDIYTQARAKPATSLKGCTNIAVGCVPALSRNAAHGTALPAQAIHPARVEGVRGRPYDPEAVTRTNVC